jgi:hypothetical protein
MTFSLKHINKASFDDEIICVFWDFENMKWSTEGCNLVKNSSNEYYSDCECDHLTNFAAILDKNRKLNSNWMDGLIRNNVSNIYDVFDFIYTIENNTERVDSLKSSKELRNIISILDELQIFLNLNEEIFNFTVASDITNHFIFIYSNLINQIDAWNNATFEDKIEIASKILLNIQHTALITSSFKNGSNKTMRLETQNIIMSINYQNLKIPPLFPANGSSISSSIFNRTVSNYCEECFIYGYLVNRLGNYLSDNLGNELKLNTKIISSGIESANSSEHKAECLDLYIR